MASPTIPCPSCGKPNPQGTPYCGYCGKQLQAAPAQQPAKTIMGYALPQNFGQPGAPGGRPVPGQAPGPLPPPPAGPPGQPPSPYGAPQQPPSPYGAPPQQPSPYAAPPSPYGAPPQPPSPYGAPPQQPPSPYGAPPQQPPSPYGAPPQAPSPYAAPPSPYGAPPQPPSPYGAQPPSPYGAPPQQPPAYGQAQPYQPPQQHGHGMVPAAAAALNRIPKSAPGTLFGIPFSLLKDQDFLNKVLRFSAIALVVSRFIPVGYMGRLAFTWDGSVFWAVIWPIIVAAIYAPSFLPKEVQEKIPPVVLKWGPFIAAYISTALTYAAVPMVAMIMLLGGGAAMGGGALAAMAWLYPLLVFGLVVRLQDEDDMIARGFIALGALGALGALLGSLGHIFDFGGVGGVGKIFAILHNIAMLIVLLTATASVIFAIPTKWVPALEGFQGFAPLATAILIIWLPLSAVLMTLTLLLGSHVLNILLLPHLLILQVAYFGVLILTAPAAFDIVKGWLQKAGVQTSAAAYTGGPAAPPPAAMTVEQRLADLDAAWSRGGMTPEEYQQRRAAILSGR